MNQQAQSLYEQICNFENILKAAQKSLRGKKHKTISAAYFYFDLEFEILRLQTELQNQTYQPQAYYQFAIRDPKPRLISAPAFRDRVVHHAICQILEPYFERKLIFDTYACRQRKGMHKAVLKAQKHARKYPFFLKADIRHYFASIDHVILKARLTKNFKDKDLHTLLFLIIEHPCPGHEKGKGLAIGNLTSQFFANDYLTPLDLFIRHQLKIPAYLRYMDDFLLFSQEQATLTQAKEQIVDFLHSQLKLKLKPSATLIAPTIHGIPFLGLNIFPKLLRLRQVTWKRFRQKFKAREAAFNRGDLVEAAWLQSAQSLFAHLSQADSYRLRSQFIQNLSILEEG